MQHNEIFRKNPKQQRAQATVDVILEATARILQTRGAKALTTNAIAELAGVSIGTLYQYFPNKKAIMTLLARKELAATSDAVNAGITLEMEQGAAQLDPVRVRIRALINGFKGRQRARKALIEMLIANGLAAELARPVDLVMQNILTQQSEQPTARPIKPVTAYVLTRAVIGTLRAALMEESPFLGTLEFEDELVKLVKLVQGLETTQE
jgi:AcrR family transcriptional regulator